MECTHHKAIPESLPQIASVSMLVWNKHEAFEHSLRDSPGA
jgi:hypothetical protein